MSGPAVSICMPRSEHCRAQSGLVDGLHLECRLFWPERTTVPTNLSEQLTQSYRQDWKHYRVLLGDLEFSFSRYQTEDRFRLDEVGAFTNPRSWKREALSAPPTDAMGGCLLFDVPYDEHEVVYTVGDRADPVFDARNKRLRTWFTKPVRDGRWIALADTLFAIVDGSELLALQFEAFAIVEDQT